VVARDVSARKEMEKTLRQRVSMERLLGDISRKFIDIGERGIRAKVEEALEQIGRFLGVDRLLLRELDEERTLLATTHCWCAEGVPLCEEATPVAGEGGPAWGMDQMESFQPLVVERLEDLPASAGAEREAFRRAGVRSAVVVPLSMGRAWMGMLGCHATEERAWSETELVFLRFCGKILSGSLDRERSEKRRRGLEARLLHAQKLESLGMMAGGIAHDFNNLLTGVLGNVDLALADLGEDAPARWNIELIRKAGQRLSELTGKILDYAGKPRSVIERVDLSDLAKDMVPLLEASIDRKTALAFEGDPTAPPIEADPGQIRQVVMNLIANASEALDGKEGTVTVRTGAASFSAGELDASFTGEIPGPGAYVFLEVEDTGPGVDEETLAKVFDPFFTTKSTGRGLGLATVLGIVRGHGGAMLVDSVAGKGSRFRVLLPAGAPPRRVAPEAAGAPRGAGGGNGTVLLVDDEKTVRKVGQAMLEKVGYEVLIARDGREGLSILEAGDGAISAVLLDLAMPGLDGAEVLRRIRRRWPGLPVLLVSGFSEEAARARYAFEAPSGFLQKPFRRDILLRVLQDALSG